MKSFHAFYAEHPRTGHPTLRVYSPGCCSSAVCGNTACPSTCRSLPHKQAFDAFVERTKATATKEGAYYADPALLTDQDWRESE